ncbi:hypothetical protein [Helicobacter bizzozeronii]|uniref:hypothetical protein n=1 Tax=Helicobacter bizzozeronii TaxID=56877 RepID=UPI000CEF4D10|nr:hypothetical protein [Helicobacter bizzozeronii]
MKRVFLLSALMILAGCGAPSAGPKPQAQNPSQCASPAKQKPKTLTNPNPQPQEECPDNGEPKQVE